MPQRQVGHPHKRLQHLAGRYLLRFLFPDFPVELIRIADTRKPFLEDEAYHFSISHCGDFAAAIVSKTQRVGVDIEEVRPTVGKVQHKFVSELELDAGKWELGMEQGEGSGALSAQGQLPGNMLPMISPDLEILTLIWSCKEAVYKWFAGICDPDQFNGEVRKQKPEQIAACKVLQPFVRVSYLSLGHRFLKEEIFTLFYLPDS